MASPMLILLLAVVIIGFVVAGVALWRLSERVKPQDSTGLVLLQGELNGLRAELQRQLQGVQSQMAASQSSLGERLDKASLVFGQVQQSLGGLAEATGQIQRLGLSMGQELGRLQTVFQPPKLRGGIGELLLENLLANIIPTEKYALQYGFKSGAKVDAVIRLPEGLVPVDAKFPLENFRRMVDESLDDKARQTARREFARDVKKHIDDIAEKYILTDEGTLELALMYIPAENVYYEAVLREDDHELYRYAQEKRVFPVSPNSFYAYLSALVQGFRGLKIAEQAREIQAQMGRLHVDLAGFAEDFVTVGKHLGNAQTKYAQAEKRLTRLQDKLEGLKSGSALPADQQPALPEA